MQRTKDQVKPWFAFEKYPTEEQFYDFFDSIIWKGEVAIEDINGLIDLLQTKVDQSAFDLFQQGQKVAFDADGYFDIPQGYLLEKAIILPGVDANIKIGNAAGADDISPEMLMSAANGEVVVLNLYARAIRRIYFTGITAGSFIIFFNRKIKS
jgi:hypothetical protein